MRKGLVKKFWIFMVSLLMIIGNMQSFVFAEGESNLQGYANVTKVEYKDSTGVWHDITDTSGTKIKNNTELRFNGEFGISNIDHKNEDATLDIDLGAINVTVNDYARSLIKPGSGWTSEYEIKNNHLIIYLTAKDRLQSDIEGDFEINGKVTITDSTIQDGQPVSIKLDGKTITITYDNPPTTSVLSANKMLEGGVYKGADGNYYQNYKIELRAKDGNVRITSFNDTLGSSLAYSGQVFVKNANGIDSVYNSIQEIPATELAKDTSMTISYTAKLNTTANELFNTDNYYGTYTNKFNAGYTNNRDEEKNTGNSEVTVNVNKPTVKKSGVYDSATNSITWTIVIDINSYKDLVNGDVRSLASYLSEAGITDTAGEGLENVVLTSDNFTTDGDGKFTATYTTRIKDGVDISNGKTFKNDVTVNFKYKPVSAQGSVTVGPAKEFVRKTFDSVDPVTGIFTWNVSVKLENGMTEVSLVDAPDNNTQDPKAYKILLGSTVLFENGQMTEAASKIMSRIDQYYYVEMFFKQSYVNSHVGETLVFTYQTKLNQSGLVNGREYTNTANLKYTYGGDKNTQSSTAKYKYESLITKKATGQNEGDNVSGGNALKYTITVDLKDNSNYHTGSQLVIKDTVNNGFVIDPNNIQARTSTWSHFYADKQNSYYGEVTYDADHQAFVITISEALFNWEGHDGKKELEIIYYAYPSADTPTDNTRLTIQNRAEGTIDGNTIGTSITNTDYTLPEVLKKTAIQSSHDGVFIYPFVDWSVEVNPAGIKLNNGQSMTAVDTLGVNSVLSYDLSSISVTNLRTGTPLEAGTYTWSYDTATNSVTFTLPDEMPIKIAYKTNINASKGTELNARNASNTFVLYGSSNDTISDKTYNMGGEYRPTMDISGSSAQLTITKYDADNNQNVLAGAEFKLYRVKYQDGVMHRMYTTPIALDGRTTFTTGTDGKVVIKGSAANGLRLDQIYEVVETKAPEGYKVAPSTYIVFKGNDFAEVKMPDAGSKYAVQIQNSSVGYISIADTATTTPKGTLTVEKTFKGINESLYPDSVKFTVTKDDGTYSQIVDATKANDYQVTLSDLELGTYTVQEIVDPANAKVEGYTFSIAYAVGKESTQEVTFTGASQQTVSVTNTYKSETTEIPVRKVWSDPETEHSGVQVALMNGNATVATLTLNKDNAWTGTLTNLPKKDANGNVITYTVKEVTEVAGYTPSYTKDSDGTLVVTNTKVEHPTSSFTFTKTFAGATISDEMKKAVTFTVTGPAITGVKTVKLSQMTQVPTTGIYSYTISGIPEDKFGEYTVTETNNGLDDNTDYTCVTTMAVGGTSTATTSQEVTVNKEAAGRVDITNEYTQVEHPTSSLTFTKTFAGATISADMKKDVTFTVSGPAITGVKNVSLSQMTQDPTTGIYSYTIANIPEDKFGTYTVTETNNGLDGNTDYTCVTTMAVGGTSTATTSQEITVNKEIAGSVDITNTYFKKVSVSKKTLGGEEISGATLSLKDSTGNVVESWTSNGVEHKVVLSEGTYTLHEDSAPAGYAVANDITFTVDAEGKVSVDGNPVSEVVMVDNETSVSVSKVDILDNHEIEGAHIQIIDDQGKVVEEWDSTNEAHVVTRLTTGKKYILRETTAPEGYLLTQDTHFELNADGTINAGETTTPVSETGVLLVQDTAVSKVSYTVTKVWNDGGVADVTFPESIEVKLLANNGIAGTVQLNAENNWTYTWESLPKTNSNGVIITYSVSEVHVDGFNSTVNPVVDGTTGNGLIKLTNTYSEGKAVKISKQDVGGKEIGGAQMTLKNENGDVISNWTSVEGEDHTVTVKPGKYTLHENSAPAGYVVASDVMFTVDAEGKVFVDGNPVSEVVMIDEYASHDVVISKVDAANNKELAGAVLKVTDKEGNEVDKWTSEDGKNHTVTVKPGTYTFTEVSAPKGYELAESITFNVDLNGKVTIDGKEVTVVVMKDAKKPTNVQTGVHTNVGGFGALGGFSIGMAFIVLFLRKKMD